MRFFVSVGLWSSFNSGFSMLTNIFKTSAQNSSDMKVAAVILLLSALVLFLFLVILLYVKAMVMFLQRQSEEDIEQKAKERIKHEKVRRLEMEIEIEKELERELDKARIQKINTEQEEFIAKQNILDREKMETKAMENEEKQLEEMEIREKTIKENELQETKKQEEILQEERQKKQKENDRLELDWKKGQKVSPEIQNEMLRGISLQYQQQKRSLTDLLGLILNMLSRNVDDYKIAQTIKFRTQKENIEDDILQTIESIKGFINLCNQGKFLDYRIDGLPTEESALYNLAHGDVSQCLVLLERLMNDNIDKSSRVRLEQKRDAIFAETSDCATIFGSLASINDVMLATGSFELAIELSPKNISAWNKLGDMYMKADAKEKAVWAYNNLLDMADPTIYARQVANANAALSRYNYMNGESIVAAKMYNESKRYYDSIGINNDLSASETDVIGVIESNQEENLRNIVAQLLHARLRQ